MVHVKEEKEELTEWVNKTFMDELENISISNLSGDKSDVPIVVRIVTLDDFRILKGEPISAFNKEPEAQET